jgi:RNA polymerase sigma factor (sigma-70 family)
VRYFSVVTAIMDAAQTELLARFKRGEADAFGAIYERFKAGLYGYALSLCQDATQAQDLVQEVWLRFIQRVGDLAPDVKLGPYLYTAVRNSVIDAARRRKSEQAALQNKAAQELVEPADPVAGAEEAARVNAAIAELPDDQRETLLLKLYGSFTFEEMAEVVGAPAKTVMSRYRLALEKLNKALAERA